MAILRSLLPWASLILFTDKDAMALLALYAVALFLGVCFGIESRYSMARLFIGRAIVSETFLQKRPKGMQDAITNLLAPSFSIWASSFLGHLSCNRMVFPLGACCWSNRHLLHRCGNQIFVLPARTI